MEALTNLLQQRLPSCFSKREMRKFLSRQVSPASHSKHSMFILQNKRKMKNAQRRFVFFLFGGSLAGIVVLPRFDSSAVFPVVDVSLQYAKDREERKIALTLCLVYCTIKEWNSLIRQQEKVTKVNQNEGEFYSFGITTYPQSLCHFFFHLTAHMTAY